MLISNHFWQWVCRACSALCLVLIYQVSHSQELVVPRGHDGGITTMKFSDDEELLVTTGYNTLKVWQSKSGRLLFDLPDHTEAIRDFVITRDNKKLFSLSYDKTIKVWDLETGKSTASLNFEFYSFLFLGYPGTDLFVIGNEEIVVIDTETLTTKKRLRFRNQYAAGSYIQNALQNNNELLLQFSDSLVYVNMMTGAVPKRISLKESGIKNFYNNTLKASQDHRSFTTFSYNTREILVSSWAEKPRLITLDKPARDIIFTNNKSILILQDDHSLVSYDLDRDKVVQTFTPYHQSGKLPNKLYFRSPHLIVEINNSLQDTTGFDVLDIGTMNKVSEFFVPTHRNITQLYVGTKYATACATQKSTVLSNNKICFPYFLNASNWLVLSEDNLFSPFVSEHYLGKIMMKTVKQEEKGLPISKPYQHYEPYLAGNPFTVSPLGTYFVVKGFYEEKVLLKTGFNKDGEFEPKVVCDIRPKNTNLDLAFFTNDEKRLVIGFDSTARIYDPVTGKLLKGDLKIKSLFHTYAISNDHLAINRSDKELSVFDFKTNKETIVQLPERIDGLQFISPGELLVTCWNSCFLYDVKSSNTQVVLTQSGAMSSIVDANRQIIYILHADGSIRAIDLRSKRVLAKLESGKLSASYLPVFPDGILSPTRNLLLASANGKYLVSHTHDSTVRVWNIETQKEIFAAPCIPHVYKIAIREDKGQVIVLQKQTTSYGRNDASYDHVRVYDFLKNKMVFSDSGEAANFKQRHSSDFESILKEPLQYYEIGDQGSKIKSVHRLDYHPQVFIDDNFSTFLVTYSGLYLVYKLDSLMPRWNKAGIAYNHQLSPDGARISFLKDSSDNTYKWVFESNIATNDERRIITPIRLNSITRFGYVKGEPYLYGEVYGDKNATFYLPNKDWSISYLSNLGGYMDIDITPDHSKLFLFNNNNDQTFAELYDIDTKKLIKKFVGKFNNFLITYDGRYLILVGNDTVPTMCYNLKTNAADTYAIPSFYRAQYVDKDLALFTRSGNSIIVDLKTRKLYFNPGVDIAAYFNNQFVGYVNGLLVTLKDHTVLADAFPYQHRNAFHTAICDSVKQYIYSVGNDNLLIKWNVQTGIPVTIAEIASSSGKQLYFNTDSTLVVISNDNKGVEYNTRDLSINYIFVPNRFGGTNLFSPTNQYAVDKTDIRTYYFRVKNRLFDFEQFDLVNNRPDLLLPKVGYSDSNLVRSYHNAWRKRVKRAGFLPQQLADQWQVPELELLTKDFPITTPDNKIRFEIKARDSLYRLNRVNVWNNGVPVFGVRGFSIQDKKSKNYKGKLSVLLSQGRNKITISVMNEKGVESLKETILINSTAANEPAKTYFIGVGMNHFMDSAQDLDWSVKDIRDLGNALKKKIGGTVLIDTLFNEQFTEQNLVLLKKKLQESSVNDRVIVAYSGHGLLSKDYDYYLSTYQVNFENPEKGGLSYEILENLLDSIPARKRLMFLDACHSGEVDKEELAHYKRLQGKLDSAGVKRKGTILENTDSSSIGMKNSFELMQELFVDVGRNIGATVIAAAAGTQLALEKNKLGNGVFTFSILEYIEEQETSTVSALKVFVNKRVMELTEGLQVPTVRTEAAGEWQLW